MMRTATQRAALLATVIAAGCLIAACGSSKSTGSSSKTTASSGSSSSGTGRGANATLAACLHKHGVSFTAGSGAPGGGTPPSGAPGSGGPPAGAGSTTGGPPSGSPGSRAGGSKFQAALKACGAKLPSGAGPRSTGFSRQAIQKYVSCVRQHGYKLPNPNLSGTGPVFPSRSDGCPRPKTDQVLPAAPETKRSEVAGATVLAVTVLLAAGLAVDVATHQRSRVGSAARGRASAAVSSRDAPAFRAASA